MIRIKEPVTKVVTKRPRVTKPAILFIETPDDPIGLLREMLGRPRKYTSLAEKQRAYRLRKKAAQ